MSYCSPPKVVKVQFKARLRAHLGLFRDRECPLCSKLLTQEHENSRTHAAKFQEHIDLDVMVSPTPAPRTLTPMMGKVTTPERTPTHQILVKRLGRFSKGPGVF